MHGGLVNRLLIAGLCVVATAWAGVELHRSLRDTVVTCGVATPSGVAVRLVWQTTGARVVGDVVHTSEGAYRMAPGEMCLIGEMPELTTVPAKPERQGARAL
jgi:hypothetical protein